MKTTLIRRRWSSLAVGVAAASVLLATALSPVDAFGQGRGPGGRSRDSGGGSGRGDSGPSRREESRPPERRSEEQRPPERRREESRPPERREEQRPPQRREESAPPTYRREEQRPPQRREESAPPTYRREEQRPPQRREESAPPTYRREEQRPPQRREESAPSDRRVGPGNGGPNPGDSRPGIGGSRYDRSGRDGAGGQFNRRPGDRTDNRGTGRDEDRGTGLDRRPGDRSDDRANGRDNDRGPAGGIDRRPGDRNDNRGTGLDRRPGDRGNERGNWDGRGGSNQGRRDDARRNGPSRNDAHAIFTRSREGRRFQNGVSLRTGAYVSHPTVRRYFRDSYCYYPWYSPVFQVSLHYYSPYSYYWGICPPYILRHHTWHRPPSVVYIEVPIYVSNWARGYDGDTDDYYLGSGGYGAARYSEAGLGNAIEDIEAAFRYGEIERMVNLTDPQLRIAIYRRGQYDYSLSADDYLDMTRDAMRNMDAIEFNLHRVRRRTADVFTASGRHVFRDGNGARRMVYVSFVLERVYGRWTITQVGTSPDEIRG